MVAFGQFCVRPTDRYILVASDRMPNSVAECVVLPPTSPIVNTPVAASNVKENVPGECRHSFSRHRQFLVPHATNNMLRFHELWPTRVDAILRNTTNSQHVIFVQRRPLVPAVIDGVCATAMPRPRYFVLMNSLCGVDRLCQDTFHNTKECTATSRGEIFCVSLGFTFG